MLRLTPLALAAGFAASAAAASEPAPIAFVQKITVDDQDRLEATDKEVRVIRAATSSLVQARKSLLLFEGDQLSTGANVSLVLLFLSGAAEEEKTVVVGAATDIRVGSSLLELILGRILSNVRGFFEVERPEGILGARGTEFEVRAGSDGSTELRVLEGAVEVAAKGERPPSPEETRPAAFKVAVTSGRVATSSLSVTVRNGCGQDHIHEVRAPENLAWVSLVGERFSVAPGGQRTVELNLKLDASRVAPGVHRGDILVTCLDCVQEPGCAVSSEPLALEVTVKGDGAAPAAADPPAFPPRIAGRLERVTLRRGRSPEPTGRLAEGDVRSVVDWTSGVLLAGRPAYSRRGSALYLESVEARDQAFRDSRFRAVWLQSAPDYEQLGNIYCDWGEGAKGLEAYQRAGKADPARRASPAHLAGLAEAFRLKGHLDEAEARAREALRLEPRSPLALLTLGNLRLDQANVAADRGDVSQARDRADEALHAFDEASRAPGRRDIAAVARANRGDTLLALGAFDRQEGKIADAHRRFADAERAFESAREVHRPYPYSDAGLADVSRGYFGVEMARGQKDRAQLYLKQSEERYRRALSEKRAPFAAWTGLAALYHEAGRDDRAIQAYSRAVELQPDDPLAHYRLGAALAKSDPQRAAQHARTYLELEAPVFKQGQRAQLASALAQNVEPPPPLPPSPPLPPLPTRVPSILGLSLEAAERSLRAAGFKPGDVGRRTSSRPEGSVIDQKPGPGEPAPAGSRVDLVAATPAPVGGDVKVPNVEGDPEREALEEVRKKRLVARVRRQAACERLGRVIAQEPRKDSRVPEGSEVTITVASAGDRPVKVPEVERLPRSRAEGVLRKAGLVVGRVRTMQTSSTQADLVLDQEPDAGQLLAPGCAVDLTIAEREPLVRVPDFRGLTEKEALSRLNSSAGLASGRINSGGSGGKVVNQEPAPGAQVARGSTVSLWIRPNAKDEPPRDRVLVPNVRKSAVKSAIDTLRRAGLSASVKGKGTCVIDQRPAAKTSVDRGSTVTLEAGACPTIY